MAEQKQRNEDLSLRFLSYLNEELSIALEQKESADRMYLEASKRLWALEKEIATINGKEVD